MIDDDLPTNEYYLEESFGAAGGLREFSDGEFSDISDEEGSNGGGRTTPTRDMVHHGIISNHGGETVKILDATRGVRIIENYFDNLNTNLVLDGGLFE